MTASSRLLLVAAATLTAAGCASSPQPASPSASASATVAAGAANAMVATLAPVSSPVTGSVRLEPTGRTDQVRATVSVRGANMGAELPWQIRQGRCDEQGPEVGPQAAYRTLSVRADGSADARMTLPIAMPSGGTYSVRVLLSKQQMDRTIACGVLSIAQ